MNISNLYWHDGVITGLKFNPIYDGQSEIILTIELFADPKNAPDRDALQIKCLVP